VITVNGGETLTIEGIEDLIINLGDGDNVVTLSGDFDPTDISQNTFTLNTGSGDDVIDASLMTSEHDAVINTDGGSDTVIGLPGNDMIDGGTDDDSIMGAAGDDLLIGGAGNDDIDGGAGDDTIVYSGSVLGYDFTTSSDGTARREASAQAWTWRPWTATTASDWTASIRATARVLQ